MSPQDAQALLYLITQAQQFVPPFLFAQIAQSQAARGLVAIADGTAIVSQPESKAETPNKAKAKG